MIEYQIGWTVFGLVAALTWIAAWSFTKWREAAVQAGVEREAAGHHFRAMRRALAAEAAANRQVARLAQARPDRAAEALRLSARLSSVPVMSAGVIALVEELQRTSACDRDLDPADAARSLSLPVSGDIAIQAIVRNVIQAVDEAILDLDVARAASAAEDALVGGEPAPIEDVLASLRAPAGDTIRRIPIRTLGDVAADARRDRIFRAQAAASEAPVAGAPTLTWKVDGIQPDEAIVEADGTWTLRRREAPAGEAWPSPLETRGLSDQDMIDRGFDLDALLSELPIRKEGDERPLRIDLVPRDRAQAAAPDFGATVLFNGERIPCLSLKRGGIQPTEAVLEADGTWTVRRADPFLEDRQLSDLEMIRRGFDVDAMRAKATAAIPGRGGDGKTPIPPIAIQP